MGADKGWGESGVESVGNGEGSVPGKTLQHPAQFQPQVIHLNMIKNSREFQRGKKESPEDPPIKVCLGCGLRQ